MVEEPIELLGMYGAGRNVVGGLHDRDKTGFIEVLLVTVRSTHSTDAQRMQKLAASMTTRPRSSPA